jgi:hypothetical protein
VQWTASGKLIEVVDIETMNGSFPAAALAEGHDPAQKSCR